MPKLMKAVTVHKPVHEVFEYVDEPMHLPEIWPSLYEVKAVEAKPVRKFDWLYNLAGKHFAGKTKTIEHVVDERIVEKAEGEIESTFIWKFQGQNGFTKLAFEADYKLPVGAGAEVRAVPDQAERARGAGHAREPQGAARDLAPDASGDGYRRGREAPRLCMIGLVRRSGGAARSKRTDPDRHL